MFKREILEKVEKDFHARRKYEEQVAAQRVRELEEKMTLCAFWVSRSVLLPPAFWEKA